MHARFKSRDGLFACALALAAIACFGWVGMLAPPVHAAPPTPEAARKTFWSFQPVHRPALPRVVDEKWARNPADRFILARLEAKHLAPAPPADKIALIRRATYDLLGLPPTPAEVDAFLADRSPDAYEKVVDRLLASPHYGEKWGRHWLDLVRYGESNSYERDDPKPNVWRYRDYVIRSFNEDKPYDRFVKEQLAGDEMPDAKSNPDDIIATGFYRLGIWDDEPSDRLQARYDNLDDIVTTTGQVFLGLTIDCARCHNHKIDPILQTDYYSLLSFFQNINDYHNTGPTDQAPLPGRPSLKAGKSPDMALCVSERGATAPQTYVCIRGNANVRGEIVYPRFPRVLDPYEPVISLAPDGAKTCGRRTVLANWIASNQNPLFARVMANRLFQYHFGRGIVRSPNNFGIQGDKPTHPLLLDWLASEFIANGYHMKPIHRLLMTSSAYRMSCQMNVAAAAVDPGNDLLWRFDLRRLTAEEVRDSILAVNGTLNLKIFGPSVYPPIPKAVLAGQSVPGRGWGKSTPEEAARRSIYVHVKRSLPLPILQNFDSAETDHSCPVRFVTVQPTQALGMLNGAFINEQAGVFAARVHKETGEDVNNQVALAWKLATCRPPSSAELARSLTLIQSLQKQGATQDAAMKGFCLMMMNLNEFVFVD